MKSCDINFQAGIQSTPSNELIDGLTIEEIRISAETAFGDMGKNMTNGELINWHRGMAHQCDEAMEDYG